MQYSESLTKTCNEIAIEKCQRKPTVD